jgi:metal-responsive CopG/Arc/MetJ family transcriptional regulator
MRTTISIPDDVFESADQLARELSISRSKLYSTAVAEYIAKHRAEDVRAKLNEVYAEQPSGLPPEIRQVQARSIGESVEPIKRLRGFLKGLDASFEREPDRL